MTRISRGQHTHQTAIANDPSKDISANQWNDIAGPVYAHVETGMLGIPASVTSIVLSSGAALVVDTHSVIQASVSPGSDTLKNITNTNTNAKDILALIAKSGDTITVSHNDSGTGNIFCLGAVNKTLSETVPMMLFRVGSNWYEFNLSTSIVNAEISGSAAIAYGKLNLSGSIVNADINSSAAIAASKINGTAAVLNVNNVFTAGLTMSGADITLAGNNLKTTNFTLNQSTGAFNSGLLLQNSSGNNTTSLFLAPSGTQTSAGVAINRLSTISANTEFVVLGADQQGANEFTLQVFKQGTGTLRPLNVYMSSTKLLSFDTANTITSYVNFFVAGATFLLGDGSLTNYYDMLRDGGTGFLKFSGNQSSFSGYEFYTNNGSNLVLNIDNGGVMTLINTLKPVTSSGTTGQFAFDSSGGSNVTIANNATATPFGTTTLQGIFTVTNTNSGKTAFFFLGGDGTPVILSQGTSTEYTVTSGSAGKTNVFTSGGVVTIENKIGSSQNYKVTAWRVA